MVQPKIHIQTSARPDIQNFFTNFFVRVLDFLWTFKTRDIKIIWTKPFK